MDIGGGRSVDGDQAGGRQLGVFRGKTGLFQIEAFGVVSDFHGAFIPESKIAPGSFAHRLAGHHFQLANLDGTLQRPGFAQIAAHGAVCLQAQVERAGVVARRLIGDQPLKVVKSRAFYIELSLTRHQARQLPLRGGSDGGTP